MVTRQELRVALGDQVTAVVESADELRIGALTQEGHFVLYLKDDREIGAFAQSHAWDLELAPYFWFTLNHPTGNLVVEPTEEGLKLHPCPKELLASEFASDRPPAMMGGNANRTLFEIYPGQALLLTTEFVEHQSLMSHAMSVVYLWMEENKTVAAANFGVNYVRDRREAINLLCGMTNLLPSWLATEAQHQLYAHHGHG